MHNSIVLSIFLFAFLQVSAERKTIWSGVYTESQAVRGEQEYVANCSACHGVDLDGVAHLKGADFMDRWREFNVLALYDFVSQSMPRPRDGSPNKPGSLSESTYVSILAYIFRSNSFPAGDEELSTARMKTVQIEGKDGPKPAPNGALVQIVGCMARRGTNWVLANATEPLRTSTSRSSTEEESGSGRSRSLGQHRFVLSNLGYLGPDFKPETYAGHRLLAKGFIVWQTGNARINITALESLAETCR